MRRSAPIGLLFAGLIILLAALLWRLSTPPPPDPRLVDISVRSTLFALPTPTAHVIEVTRIVEVTRVMLATVTPGGPAPGGSPTATVTSPVGLRISPEVDPLSTPMPPVAGPVAPSVADASGSGAAPADLSSPEVQTELMVADVGPAPPPATACSDYSERRYETIPVASGRIDHPDSIHGDLNLWLRGWAPVDAPLNVVDINGPADGDPPQLAGIVGDGRLPTFTSAYQVYDWDWNCGGDGCRGSLLTGPDVMLLGLQTYAGENLSPPSRGSEIYGGGFRAMVLYAEPARVTLGYTREDGVANGYVVHLENLCVDPNLVNLYRENNAAGRGSLPGLHNGEVLGTAGDTPLLVAVRDRGVFLDPRSRKDWWRGF